MCEKIESNSMKNDGFYINFNQDFTSITVVGSSGYRLFTLSTVERIDEIFCSNNENTRIAERLFSSSLVAVVTVAEPNKLKVCHFKKGTEICNYSYPCVILSVRLNRARLVVCLRDSIYIHSIRDMKLLNSIRHISQNELGLCTLSLDSRLAYPVSATTGELQIFDAESLKVQTNINAHDSPLSAINFAPNGSLIATASERGTVIRVFCTSNGQKVHEFRRGMKRNVQIASLIFSLRSDYICVSSNTETVHIFKIDPKTVETTERKAINSVDKIDNENASSSEDLDAKQSESSSWTSLGFLTKAVTSYFPSQVSDVLNQDRAFATVLLSQAGLKYVCALGKLENETRLLVACEDGFLYIYSFDEVKGGECKLLRVHDLRHSLDGVTELNMSESLCDSSKNGVSKKPYGTYASVLKGSRKNSMTDSDKCRDLSEAVDIPPKSIFDEVQFPPVAVGYEA